MHILVAIFEWISRFTLNYMNVGRYIGIELSDYWSMFRLGMIIILPFHIHIFIKIKYGLLQHIKLSEYVK